MKADIRQRALELGFDDCRFTTAAPPATAAQYQDWLAGKHHGEMAWLERNAEKRVDPQKVLPGAKSVIVLAASYEAGDKWQVTSDEKPPGSESQLSTLNPVKGVAPTGLYAPQLSAFNPQPN